MEAEAMVEAATVLAALRSLPGAESPAQEISIDL